MLDPDGPETGAQHSRRRSVRGISLAVALALSLSAALVLSYELAQPFLAPSNEAVFLTPGSTEDGPATAEIQFSFLERPAELPEIHFVDGDDRPLTLGDFRGRPILLNIWATWCLPCRKEMPSLDRLQAKFDPSQFLVLTLSIDQQGAPVVRRFYQELGLKSLGIYVDRPGAALNLLRAPGVPTTLFVDRNGLEIGRKIGPAEWDSPETVALLREHINVPLSEQAKGEPK